MSAGHVLSSSYKVSRLELRNKRKAKQHWNLCVVKDFVLNKICVNHERVYAYNVLIKLWFQRSFSSQHYSKFITNKNSDNLSQILTKECKTRFFICKVKLNSLRSSRHFNGDAFFAVIVSFLNESFHGLNNISKGRVKTRFQIVEF